MKKKLLTATICFATIIGMAQSTDVFISEYVEGTGNDKAIELFNPTLSPINLSTYRLVRYSNGSATPVDSMQLTGTIASGATFVIVNGQTTGNSTSPACDPALQALANQLDGAYPAPTYMNGDDALVIVKVLGTRQIVDIFGKIGEDPGVSWTDVFPYNDASGAYWTKDQTLERKATVNKGVTINPSAFDPTVEWDSLPNNTWTGLGKHYCSTCLATGATGINEKSVSVLLIVYPNPASTNGVLNIVASDKINSVELFDITGKVVKAEVVNKLNEFALNLSHIDKGVYFARIHTIDGGTAERKITIQ